MALENGVVEYINQLLPEESAAAPTLLMKFPPEANVMEPPVVIIPFNVIVPLELAVRFPPIVDVVKFVARELVKATLLAPVLLRDTAPVKLLPALFKVMVLAPALIVACPAPEA